MEYDGRNVSRQIDQELHSQNKLGDRETYGTINTGSNVTQECINIMMHNPKEEF